MILLILFFAVLGQEVSDLQPLEIPAGPGSGQPNLVLGEDGKLYLSWIEPAGEERHALHYSIWEKDHWSSPKKLVEGGDWFVNWADFPSLAVLESGRVIPQWLVRSGPEKYAYDVHLKWGREFIPHTDGTQTEHGFVSMIPWEGGRLGIFWLDGRNFAGESPSKDMTLRFGVYGLDGMSLGDVELDGRTCECCQTSATRVPGGAFVVYRDRSAQEIRDIAMVRLKDGRWSEPKVLWKDGWKIEGCPVNGPSVAAKGPLVAVAWFTAAGGVSRAKVIFSEDGGDEFGKPIVIDQGNPLGRMDLVMLEDGSVLVSWIELLEKGAEILVRRVRQDGSMGKAVRVAESSRLRASGFPQVAVQENQFFLVWTEVVEPGRVLGRRGILKR